jgi:hypothetical protein
MMAAGVAGGMVAMTRSAAGAASSAAGMTSRAVGTAVGGASAGGNNGGGPGPSLGGAAKGALVASGKALFRGAASAVSRAAAPIAENFKLGMQGGQMDVDGPATAPAWAAAARARLRTGGR